jgi:hypothetical protein
MLVTNSKQLTNYVNEIVFFLNSETLLALPAEGLLGKG